MVLCIKSGVVDVRSFQMDGSPQNMRAMVAQSNAILAGTKTIDLFCCARVDPHVPVEDTVAELGRLVAEGRSAASRCPR